VPKSTVLGAQFQGHLTKCRVRCVPRWSNFLLLAAVFEGPDVVFACRRLRVFGLRLGRTQDDLAVDGERLQDDVEALAVLVHESRSDVEPKIVLALTLDDGVRLVGRLLSSHS